VLQADCSHFGRVVTCSGAWQQPHRAVLEGDGGRCGQQQVGSVQRLDVLLRATRLYCYFKLISLNLIHFKQFDSVLTLLGTDNGGCLRIRCRVAAAQGDDA